MSLVVAALLMAEAAAALPAPPPGPPPEVEEQVFIAPSGEPFRAPFGQPYPVAVWFAGADTNHDGKLTSTEFLIDFMRFFDSLDVNRDGQLDASEVARYETDIAPEVRGAGPGGAGGPPGGRGGPPGGMRPGGDMRGAGGGGWSPGAGSQRLFQSMGDMGMDTGASDGQSGDSQSEYRPSTSSARGGPFVREQARGGARYDLLAIPEPVTAMGHDLSGVVLRRDALAASTARFNALDRDGQGYLTLKDLPETATQGRKPKKRKDKR